MTTASLELCKELFELSRWSEDYMEWYQLLPDSDEPIVFSKRHNTVLLAPAYDLGYLLRKLPSLTRIRKNDIKANRSVSQYRADYREGRFKDPACYADTPEDAACKLAIELIKAGVLNG